MASRILCFFFLFLSSFQGEKRVLVEGSRNRIGFKPKQLFVFGDSYADTGNNPISLASSWKPPYGATFPGKPIGRFSDGRVLTDFFAKFLEIRTPIAYRWRRVGGRSHLKYGMNFAAGGTGVFETLFPGPNMTTQIDSFQAVLASGYYTKRQLTSSVSLVTISGNDYSAYIRTNGSAQGFPAFIKRVVDQIEVNLKRIHESGVKKLVVAALQPLGCLPSSTYSLSFKRCNATQNALVRLHNKYLHEAVTKLNQESNSTSFVVLDLNQAFFTVFKQNQLSQGNPTFGNPYKPCCTGTRTEYSCGSVDARGRKLYTVCPDPGSFFFWDGAHPTQAGWKAVYSTLAVQTTLKQLS